MITFLYQLDWNRQKQPYQLEPNLQFCFMKELLLLTFNIVFVSYFVTL